MPRTLLRYLILMCALALLTVPGARLAADDSDHVDADYKHASAKALEAWKDMKFGLRIHWGIYSIWADGPESWPLTKHPLDWQGRYTQLYKTWNPTGFNADQWAELMRRDGFKFFDMTTKHHDGFSMYDTHTDVKQRFIYTGPNAGKIEDCNTHYSIMDTPFKRDVVKELIDAGHKYGIKPGLYFSHIDWYDADFRMDQWNPNRDKTYTPQSDPAAWARFVKRHREQIREILTKYGKISEVSLDMNFPDFAWPDVKETIKIARRLQPDCLFRNRGIGAYGDYHTPENWIPDSPKSKESPLPWEVIHTLGRYMSYDPDASAYKSGDWIVSNLVDIVAKGGLFMVGIGPDGDGTFHPKAIEALDYAGDWLRVNGSAIYATRPWTYWKEGDSIRFTRSKDGRSVYAISLKWPGDTLRLASLQAKPGSAIHMLGYAKPLAWNRDEAGATVIDIPTALQSPSARPCKQAWAFRIDSSPVPNMTQAEPAPVKRINASPGATLITLPHTRPLTWTGDLSARMVDGAHKFLDRQLEESVAQREQYWHRDLSSRQAYESSVAPNRVRFETALGAAMKRATPLEPSLSMVASMASYSVQAAVWPVLPELKPPEGPPGLNWPKLDGPRQPEGDGLLLTPKAKPRGFVIVLPDADQSPEQMAGLAPGIPLESQMARRLVENGYVALVPALIDRGNAYSRVAFTTDLSHREWIYRQGFEVGRTVIGYEVLKVRAAIDWLQRAYPSARTISAAGYGEGGLIAFYSAALDTRIDSTLVSGYFGPKEHAWEQPLYRNVWGLLHEFGDAEIASLIAPRRLIVEYTSEPAVVSNGTWPGPGRLTTPSHDEVLREVTRAARLVHGLCGGPELLTGPTGTVIPFGSEAALASLVSAGPGALPASGLLPVETRAGFKPEQRMQRQVKQMENDIQLTLEVCEAERNAAVPVRFGLSDPAAFKVVAERERKRFEIEAIGKIDVPLLPMNARTRLIYDEPKWRGYEVVLDVWPDVFAWGILCVPKGIPAGERRPVVVCQHGLEGLPFDTIEQGDGYGYYKAFASRLAERGYVTFAPHNLYRGGNRFRLLQRKANLLKASLFSIITPQHQQILNFLGTLDYVDSKRIAFYGLSYGGKTAMRVPALLPGYCLSICSGDFSEWVRVNTTVHSNYSYLNRSSEWEMPEWDLGHSFDYAEMAALIAPRPFIVERGHQDGVAPDEWVAYEYDRVRKIYDLLGIGNRTEIEFFDGPHTINGVGTFAFLDKWLRSAHVPLPAGEVR